jgi:hypothetical protein
MSESKTIHELVLELVGEIMRPAQELHEKNQEMLSEMLSDDAEEKK